ncbi:DNA-directed RNA polymerase II subunit RPB7 [Artemisia annua]|uniref:DNA-directed RNA polymerase subunit n=1 Tax=Artemisia annua TaxID=35608 RepID=A0A2U1LE38_ARTAN|nr:DNA-directed RNA polymerase II subunit RPB7 [Artemisia annua]
MKIWGLIGGVEVTCGVSGVCLLSLHNNRGAAVEIAIVQVYMLNVQVKMFFHIVLERNMQLHPRHFGRELREKLVSKLMKDVEGTCSGRHGFVVAITGIEDIGKGIIRDGTGFVTFPVKYLCVVFRPFKGEILEATVTMVNKMGFFAEAGPVQIFVSNHFCIGTIKDDFLGVISDPAGS